MRCSYPQTRWIDGQKVTYPCGHCEACLRNKRSEKALRGYLEGLSHKNSVFLTLTYSDDNLPLNDKGIPTIRKKHLDDVIKRIRKLYKEKIRVLASAEYSSTGRPHYHLCLFGMAVDWFIERSKHFHQNSHGTVLEDFKAWYYGGCLVAPFDIQTAFYVSKYLVKSDKDKKDYEALDIEPECIYQSRRPALGKAYAEEHKARLLKDGFIRCKGVKFKIPRYFMDKILNDGSDEYQDLKDRLADKANTSYSKYIKQLNQQFKGSNKHIYEQIAEEAKARENLLKKGK